MTLSWLDEVEPVAEPPFVRMGTRALRGRPEGGPGASGRGSGVLRRSPSGKHVPEEAWLLGGDDVAGQLAEKERVLAGHHEEVVAALPGTEEAATELLGALGGEPDGARHPIDTAGRMVAEDLCLLQADDTGRWVLVAGSVCFPSHWRLRDKLGLPLAAVHDPVPDYAAELADRVDRFLDKLRVGRGVWRRNWTVHTEPDLYAPEVPPPPDPSADPAGFWLRSERQTLTRLAGTGAIVFTIRTQQVPLAAIAERRDLRARLAAAVAAWPLHQVAYRGGEAVRRPLLSWLQRGDGSPDG